MTHPKNTNLIGSNIRPGFRPGGFTKLFGVARAGATLPKRRGISDEEVRKAATAAVFRLGIAPNSFKS